MTVLFWSCVGYLSGSLMFSQWLPNLFFHIDVIALSEDHNPGTANAMRLTNIVFGLLCLFLDLSKGALPVLLAAQFVSPTSLFFCPILAAPVLGHAFSPFLRFHGGKAIAVSFGVLIGFFPYSRMLLTLAACFIFFSVFIRILPNAWRVCLSFFVFCILCFWLESFSNGISSLLLSTIVILKHFHECVRYSPKIIVCNKEYTIPFPHNRE